MIVAFLFVYYWTQKAHKELRINSEKTAAEGSQHTSARVNFQSRLPEEKWKDVLHSRSAKELQVCKKVNRNRLVEAKRRTWRAKCNRGKRKQVFQTEKCLLNSSHHLQPIPCLCILYINKYKIGFLFVNVYLNKFRIARGFLSQLVLDY